MTDKSMTKAERERVILEFLAETGLALPQKPLYVNLNREREITFSQKTLKRRLDNLSDRGLIRQLDIGNGYYEITTSGREFLAGDSGAGDIEGHD